MQYKDLEKKIFLEKIYNQYYKTLYMKIYSGCFSHNPQDVEDCISEVFLIIIKNYEIIKKHPNKYAYILNIAQKVTFNFNRKYSNKILKGDPEDYLQNLSDQEILEETIENKIISEKITKSNLYRQIMGSLSKQEQELYFLRYVQGLSYNEIASLLGEKSSTIGMRISRMRLSVINKIKDFLE